MLSASERFKATIQGKDLRPGKVEIKRSQESPPFELVALYTFYNPDGLIFITPNLIDPYNASNAMHTITGTTERTSTELKVENENGFAFSMKIGQEGEWIDQLVAEAEAHYGKKYDQEWEHYMNKMAKVLFSEIQFSKKAP